MMIDRYCSRRTFMCSGRRFLIDNCIWKSLRGQIHQKYSLNLKRFLHSTSIFHDSMYIYSGTTKSKSEKMLYSINLRTNEWRGQQWSSQIQQFSFISCYTHQNLILFFGGLTTTNYMNYLLTYQVNFKNWSLTKCQGDIPSNRQGSLIIDINNNILIIGGFNLDRMEVYTDAYSFKSNIWKQIPTKNFPKNRINYKLAKCGNRIFLFGGQSTTNQQIYYNDLFEIILEHNQLQFIQLKYNSASIPIQRSSHSMIGLSDHSFIIIGGQTQSKYQKYKSKCLRDIWMFDINQLQWTQIQPKNGPFKYIRCASINLYKNILYLSGGLDQNNKFINDIFSITFAQDQIIKSELCSGCQERQKQLILQQCKFPKKPIVTVGFIYNMSLQIKFPFQAVALLTDCAKLMGATTFNIGTMKGPTQFMYIDIQFNGKTLNKQQFFALASHSYTQPRSKYLCDRLKLGSFRLGKTFIFISADNLTRKILLLSADSKVSPNFDDIYTYYAYIQNIQTGTVETNQGISNKFLITNTLKSYMNNPYEVLCSKNINKILIFSNNAVMTTQRVYYYQLISYTVDDIKLYKNPKKIKFLQDIGFNLNNDPQISLYGYLSILYLDNSLKLTINQTNSINYINYQQKLQQMKQQKLIEQIQYLNQQQFLKIKLYCYNKQNILPINYGVLIYYNNRLINRFQQEFGSLFYQKFYKTKYKKVINLWNILGIISINDKFQLNIFGTNFIPTIQYKKYYLKILKCFIKYQKNQEEHQKNIIIQEDGNKTSKKIKTK